ncbi:MAG: hypothetical protein VYE18_08155 [Pseudomonadota bacterium]|nr:hypothetical protein [Pseudomonadota bacterium]
MRIVYIREQSVKLLVDIRNAVFSFDNMTTPIVAVVTRHCPGRRTPGSGTAQTLAGFAFNSTGRYACGAQMRDSFIPRILP